LSDHGDDNQEDKEENDRIESILNEIDKPSARKKPTPEESAVSEKVKNDNQK